MTGTPFKIYVSLVLTAGAASILAAVLQWRVGDSAVLAAYLLLTILASSVKARIPGLTGSVSLGFVAVLAGVASMSLTETVLGVSGAAIAQTFWRPGARPKALQVAFNMAVLAVSTWIAYTVAHTLSPDSWQLRIVLAVAPLYLFNVGAVACLLSLLSTGGLGVVWQKFQLAVFPCYIVGAMLTVLLTHVQATNTAALLPLYGLSYMTFNAYRGWMRRLA
jgi:hypothetical protein